MPSELNKILKDIQYRTGQSLEQIATAIGYSRPHLNKAKNSKVEGNDGKIIQLLKDKYKEILQIVSNGEDIEMANIKKELPEILGDYEVRLAMLESFMQIAMPTMAEVKVKVKVLAKVSDEDIIAEIGFLKVQIQEIANRKFYEQKKKPF